MHSPDAMSRPHEELEQAAADAEAWLDSLDPAAAEAEDPADLRAIARAVRESAEAGAHIRKAVAAARANGRSWARIGMALGISRQAARERYGEDVDTPRQGGDPSTGVELRGSLPLDRVAPSRGARW